MMLVPCALVLVGNDKEKFGKRESGSEMCCLHITPKVSLFWCNGAFSLIFFLTPLQ